MATTDKEFFTRIQSATYDSVMSFVGQQNNPDLQKAIAAKISVALLEYAKELAAAGEFHYCDIITEVVQDEAAIFQMVKEATVGL